MTNNKTIQISKVLFSISFLLFTCLYSCNNPESKEEKMETLSAPSDTSMNMSADTIKTDTSGKGGQPTPTGQ